MSFGHEELLSQRGERSGMRLAIAVHSTVLGPALGGCRIWHYRQEEDGIEDAMRLARAMTMKAAAAGLDLGGGKGVICLPNGRPSAEQRRAALLDFADAVESLDGHYITAEDVGTGSEDMAVIAERTGHVVGLPPALGGGGDPSPLTARGVERAIEACCAHRFGSADLRGIRVCVVGLGHVGAALARRLKERGAELQVSDIDAGKRRLAAELDATWLDPEAAMLSRCEVLAPCALGGAVDAVNARLMQCEIVCGAANNMLAAESLAETLQRRGIVYAPDFIANAGGLIHVYAELQGIEAAEVTELVDSIGETVGRVLEGAADGDTTPLEAACTLARQRLAAPSRVPMTQSRPVERATMKA
jgi:leucine dehydrogenase